MPEPPNNLLPNTDPPAPGVVDPACLNEKVTGVDAVVVVVDVGVDAESGFLANENAGNEGVPSPDGFDTAPPKIDGFVPKVSPPDGVVAEPTNEAPNNDDFGVFDDEAAGESLAAAAALRPNVNFCPPAGAPPSGMEDAGSTDLATGSGALVPPLHAPQQGHFSASVRE